MLDYKQTMTNLGYKVYDHEGCMVELFVSFLF